MSLTCLGRLEGPDELSTTVSGGGRFLEDEGGEGGMAGFVDFFLRLFFAEDESTGDDFGFEKMWSISDMSMVVVVAVMCVVLLTSRILGSIL